VQEAMFNYPRGIAIDGKDNVYIADYGNHRIRKIDNQGIVSTIAGNGEKGFADGLGTRTKFSHPSGIAVDNLDNLYVCDSYNHKIRKISSNGVVETIAGTSKGYQDGLANSAKFAFPIGIAVDSNRNIFIADQNNHRIRKINSSGIVSTVAGTGVSGFVNGDASSAQFSAPQGVAIDKDGNIYVADQLNHQIRKISPSGIVSTLAGSVQGFNDGIWGQAKFNQPYFIGIDGDDLLVADSGNHRIRRVTAKGVVSTIAGSNFGFADGTGSSALFCEPAGIALDSAGNIVVSEFSNHAIRRIL